MNVCKQVGTLRDVRCAKELRNGTVLVGGISRQKESVQAVMVLEEEWSMLSFKKQSGRGDGLQLRRTAKV